MALSRSQIPDLACTQWWPEFGIDSRHGTGFFVARPRAPRVVLFGDTTLWVNRAGLPPEPLDTEAPRSSSLRAVLDFFPTRSEALT